MTSKSFEDKLTDLNLTNDELKRFSDAFKNEEFRKLFIEYAEEINDPKNRELYEQEIRAAEEQRGFDATLIHPNPGHVLKTSNGKGKCFINIATNEHIEKPSYTKVNSTQGANWSLPHCLAGPHEDLDHDSKMCTVYDVIFSPDTYRMAETNAKFMKMLEDSALESVETNYHCQLDRNNVKRLKMKFKGVAKPTILRKKKENHQESMSTKTENDLKQETDDIISQALSNAQNHKVVLTSHNRSSTKSPQAETSQAHTDENGYTIPIYRIVHRGQFEMQDCSNELVQQVHSMRPKELIVEIELPLCASSANVDLDVCERSLKLHCDSPKYSLDLSLPYPVRESDSHARFDKKQRKLLITLAVIREQPTVIKIHSDVDMEEESNEHDERNEESSPSSSSVSPSETTTTTEQESDMPVDTIYSIIPFEYKQGFAHLALVLYVKNIDKQSLKIDNDGQHLTICLSSLGSGCFPLQHQLCLDFPQPSVFETNENSSTVTFNDDNILILFKKTSTTEALTHFMSGVNREQMKINQFSTNKLAMTKFDFFTKKSDSSTSSTSSEQGKKMSKKQAKKLAKENRKNQPLSSDDNEQLANEISQIKIQPNQEEISKQHADEKDDKVHDMPKVRPNSSIYRRHMSESNVDLNSTSSANGEFKLKGILKTSTKYRSLSESFNEPFQGDELVFERSGTTDDLTSSNENNSIANSADSGGSSSLCTTPSSSSNGKHVRFNNQVSRKTFKPGGPVSGMKKLSSHQQRKLKKRKRQDSLNSQSSDQDDGTNEKKTSEYKNPVDYQDILARQAAGESQTDANESTAKSAVRFTNPLIFELDN